VSERISLKLEVLFAAVASEDGQGATEYAMVIGLVVAGLGLGLLLTGGAIQTFLGEVATAIGNL
jgi:hypothetical protein